LIHGADHLLVRGFERIALIVRSLLMQDTPII